MPVGIRGVRSAETSRRRVAWRAPAADPELPALDGAATRSSVRVFHSSHSGHCPCHLAVLCPHCEQTKAVEPRAIDRE